jgi:hypothetical protein
MNCLGDDSRVAVCFWPEADVDSWCRERLLSVKADAQISDFENLGLERPVYPRKQPAATGILTDCY